MVPTGPDPEINMAKQIDFKFWGVSSTFLLVKCGWKLSMLCGYIFKPCKRSSTNKFNLTWLPITNTELGTFQAASKPTWAFNSKYWIPLSFGFGKQEWQVQLHTCSKFPTGYILGTFSSWALPPWFACMVVQGFCLNILNLTEIDQLAGWPWTLQHGCNTITDSQSLFGHAAIIRFEFEPATLSTLRMFVFCGSIPTTYSRTTLSISAIWKLVDSNTWISNPTEDASSFIIFFDFKTQES